MARFPWPNDIAPLPQPPTHAYHVNRKRVANSSLESMPKPRSPKPCHQPAKTPAIALKTRPFHHREPPSALLK